MVVIPLAGGDQLGNADRCVLLAVGRVVPTDHRTSEAIRAAAREVEREPRYRANAEQVLEEIAVLPGPEQGVRLLEALAGGERSKGGATGS
jgi:UDP:flavonoid glycosyltransferase YjiC (YdhE family)